MRRPDQQLINECDPEVCDYISELEDLQVALSMYLGMHESDIAHEINDYGDLRLIFIGVKGHKPSKTP